MTCSDFVACRTYQFCFETEESLYIDHEGHRVLADVEGKGSFVASELPEQFCLWVDGIAKAECSIEFSESLIIASPAKGNSKISVLKAPVRPELPYIERVTDQFSGCGWIIESESIEVVDGIADGWRGMAQVQPVPVFLACRGKGLRVAPLSMRLVRLAELSVGDANSLGLHQWNVKNASQLSLLKGNLPEQEYLEAKVLSHLNRSLFSFSKPEGCQGVWVRRLFDAFHGRQRARVLVDGKFRGWWFEPVEDRVNRWRWGNFGFGCENAERTVQVQIDPAAGTPLWSVSRYEIYGLFPN